MKTKICIPIVEENIDDAILAIQSANSKADVIEFRVDFLENVNPEILVKMILVAEKPIIATCRLENQGGTGNITEANRKELLKAALENDVEFIDLEFTSTTSFSKVQNREIITSHHDFEKTPDVVEIRKIIEDMKAKSGDIIKYITTANSINDNFKIFEVLQENNKMVSFCMGLKGHISRVLAGKYGSEITFAADSSDKQSAPGQVEYNEIVNLYNFHNINASTEVYGIMGQFAEDSKSKYMHNPVFKKYGINAVFVPFKIEPGSELTEFVENFRKFNFAGAAVTIPHKESVMLVLDEIDDTAKAIGAVNTIKSENGKLIGYNTDCIGAMKALQDKVSLIGKKVLVLGAGGAARAIVYGLKQEQAEVTIVNRTFAKAQKLADEFGVNALEFDKLDVNEYDVYINTTSVGMYPDLDSSVLNSFPPKSVVMDIVYKPLKTKFLQIAEKCDCEIITGEKMLVWQAIAQQKIWTGCEPDFDFMSKCFFDMDA